MIKSGPSLPYFNTGAAQQVKDFRIGQFGRELDQVVTIDSAAIDAGNTPTSTLRRGLVLAKVAASGKFKDVANADAADVAIVTSSGAVTWANMASKTLTLKVDGEKEQTVTFDADDDTQAEVIAAFNAQATGVYMEANGVDKANVKHYASGTARFFQFTGGTGIAVIKFDTNIHNGSDLDCIILDEQVSLLDFAGSASDAVAHGAIAGLVVKSKLYGLTYCAEISLRNKGVIFV